MSRTDQAVRVARRFIVGSFVSDKLEEPPPELEQQDTNKILIQVRSGVGRALRGLAPAQTVEREVLLDLQRALETYGTMAPTLRVEQDVQFHLLVALKHLDPLNINEVAEDTRILDQLMDETR